MKASFLFFLFAVISFDMAMAQDTITRKNGEKICAKVLRVNTSDIEYKLCGNQDGPVHTLYKFDIVSIVYPNGTRDSFGQAQPGYTGVRTLADQGMADAQVYYKGYKRAKLWSGISAVYPFYGLISVAAIAYTRPRYETLGFPDAALMEKYEYREAYISKAYKMKKRKAWEGYGIGTGILLSIVAVVLVASYSSGNL